MQQPGGPTRTNEAGAPASFSKKDADWFTLVTGWQRFRLKSFKRSNSHRGNFSLSVLQLCVNLLKEHFSYRKKKKGKKEAMLVLPALVLLLCRPRGNVGFLLAGSRPFPRHHCGCQISSKDNVIWFWREDLIKSAQLNEGL